MEDQTKQAEIKAKKVLKKEQLKQQLVQSGLLNQKSAYLHVLASTNNDFLELFKYILSNNGIEFSDKTAKSHYVGIQYRADPMLENYDAPILSEIFVLMYARIYYGIKLKGLNNMYTVKLMEWALHNSLDFHVTLRPYKSNGSFIAINNTSVHLSEVIESVKREVTGNVVYLTGGDCGIYVYKKRNVRYPTPKYLLFLDSMEVPTQTVSPVEEDEVLTKLFSLAVPNSKEIELEIQQVSNDLCKSRSKGIVTEQVWYATLWNRITGLFLTKARNKSMKHFDFKILYINLVSYLKNKIWIN
jgi:hypothetical protein